MLPGTTPDTQSARDQPKTAECLITKKATTSDQINDFNKKQVYIEVFLYFHKKRTQGGPGGLRTSRDVYDVLNRLGVLIRVSPMLRGLTQLQKVAENDHFACSDQSSRDDPGMTYSS